MKTQNSNIYILYAPIQSGKTTALMNWIKENKINANGILTPDFWGKRKIYDIKNKVYYDFEVKNEISNELVIIGKFIFLKSGFEKGKEILDESLKEKKEWLIIDEIGKLELKNLGFSPISSEIINHFKKESLVKNKMLIVVRDYLFEKVLEKYQIKNYKKVDLEQGKLVF